MGSSEVTPELEAPPVDLDVRRVTIKLTAEAYEGVRELADATGLTLTALIRQALALFRFFHEHRKSQVFLKSEDGVMREVVLVHGGF